MTSDTITVDTRSGMSGIISDIAYRLRTDDSELALLAVLGELAKAVEFELSLSARTSVREGATWQEVGDSLGISRQAAHKRFSRP